MSLHILHKGCQTFLPQRRGVLHVIIFGAADFPEYGFGANNILGMPQKQKSPGELTGAFCYCRLVEIGINCFNGAIFVVRQLGNFHAAQMVLAPGERCVVVEQIPFALMFDNRVVTGPA